VSGLVTADLYQVRSGAIVTRRIARKAVAVRGLPDGGTVTEEVPASDQERQGLPAGLILELAGRGSRIEGHFGRPQDIGWGWSGSGVRDGPEQSSHPALPAARGARWSTPPLRLVRPRADDDRADEAARSLGAPDVLPGRRSDARRRGRDPSGGGEPTLRRLE